MSDPTEPAVLAPTSPSRRWLDLVRTVGPGLVVALTWVGAGDLVENATAGGNYGYALLWVVPLSLVFRFFLVSTIARYPLFNAHGDTSIIRGLVRLSPLLGWVFGAALLFYCYISMAFMLSGVGTALTALTGGAVDRFWGAALGAVTVAVLVGRGAYSLLEGVFKVLLAALGASFVVAVALVGVDWSALAGGLVGFRLPPDFGVFNSGLLLLSLVMSSVGSLANLIYPQVMEEKGWTTPGHRRKQQLDLLFGTVAVAFLGLCMWIVGAEVLHGGPPAETDRDIAGALGGAIGSIGTYIFYFGLLAATWTTSAGVLFSISKLAVQSFRASRLAARGDLDSTVDGRGRLYRGFVLVGLSAVVWSLPWAPGFTALTVALVSFQAPMLVLTVVALLVILNRSSMMGDRRNRWWENAILAVLLCFTLFACYHRLADAVAIVAG
ncbi:MULTISPECIES: Nramp family divalent metal transporter [unclassified Saccharopolyspora]|uniref:Nramp family divalent metal transporter n=1 Tax=unclassified Saccharopolyspora TaxID=2646250 RepID=UPI001CD72986|nr:MULTISPECIES: Nramp family divalent metal transporter [unclassified Saccharopolyspora]MCA1184943.1 Nramp family divalent metal transporter [Saccharopolyspora sp. 6T]MCA1279891.1 Nramp family divalent metal transporter [Saccharopolyspora sp. 7B]